MKFRFVVMAQFLKARHAEFFAVDREAAEAFERVLRSFRPGVFWTEIIEIG